MKALIADQLGPPENFRIRDISIPEPGPGEVLIKVIAVGLGYSDMLLAHGYYQVKPPLPCIPGSEFSGIVSQPGVGVDSFSVGEQVGEFFDEKVLGLIADAEQIARQAH